MVNTTYQCEKRGCEELDRALKGIPVNLGRIRACYPDSLDDPPPGSNNFFAPSSCAACLHGYAAPMSQTWPAYWQNWLTGGGRWGLNGTEIGSLTYGGLHLGAAAVIHGKRLAWPFSQSYLRGYLAFMALSAVPAPKTVRWWLPDGLRTRKRLVHHKYHGPYLAQAGNRQVIRSPEPGAWADVNTMQVFLALIHGRSVITSRGLLRTGPPGVSDTAAPLHWTADLSKVSIQSLPLVAVAECAPDAFEDVHEPGIAFWNKTVGGLNRLTARIQQAFGPLPTGRRFEWHYYKNGLISLTPKTVNRNKPGASACVYERDKTVTWFSTAKYHGTRAANCYAELNGRTLTAWDDGADSDTRKVVAELNELGERYATVVWDRDGCRLHGHDEPVVSSPTDPTPNTPTAQDNDFDHLQAAINHLNVLRRGVADPDALQIGHVVDTLWILRERKEFAKGSAWRLWESL